MLFKLFPEKNACGVRKVREADHGPLLGIRKPILKLKGAKLYLLLNPVGTFAFRFNISLREEKLEFERCLLS